MGASFANDKENYSLVKAHNYLLMAMELRLVKIYEKNFLKIGKALLQKNFTFQKSKKYFTKNPSKNYFLKISQANK
jgi:hypothetical protein